MLCSGSAASPRATTWATRRGSAIADGDADTDSQLATQADIASALDAAHRKTFDDAAFLEVLHQPRQVDAVVDRAGRMLAKVPLGPLPEHALQWPDPMPIPQCIRAFRSYKADRGNQC